jgi:hypothetical protein
MGDKTKKYSKCQALSNNKQQYILSPTCTLVTITFVSGEILENRSLDVWLRNDSGGLAKWLNW